MRAKTVTNLDSNLAALDEQIASQRVLLTSCSPAVLDREIDHLRVLEARRDVLRRRWQRESGFPVSEMSDEVRVRVQMEGLRVALDELGRAWRKMAANVLKAWNGILSGFRFDPSATGVCLSRQQAFAPFLVPARRVKIRGKSGYGRQQSHSFDMRRKM